MASQHRGFTLVELMVTIAVAAILLSVGVPSLKSLYDGYRGRSEISRIEQSLAFARNQAISYGMTVFVCAYEKTDADGYGVCGTDWQKGLLVYAVDSTTKNKILKVVEGFNSSDKVKGSTVSFRADGISSGETTFIYCPNGKTDESRSVKVSSAGMIKYAADGLGCS
ncbi:GspH/FimT family pseudopilin [Shewanella sp. YIC-542]|uniref:GspH/FimT family pseudopilin n=1 Tax=Shewanella mytili TaxID=3377111 RepID=UPI00398EE305